MVKCRSSQRRAIGGLLSLEVPLTQTIKHPTLPPKPIHPLPLQDPKTQAKPTEPAEVLGRHKNTGQKDHKGAR